MSKKLISLVLVLAIASIASAADFYWNSNVASGSWATMTNWKMGGTATSPVATSNQGFGDQAWVRPSLNGTLGSVVITVDADAYTSRFNLAGGAGQFNLTINDGITLTNNGTISATGFQFYNTSGSVLNIDGSLLNQRGDTTVMTVKVGGSASGLANIVNINDGGIMTVKNTATHNAVFAVGNTAVGSGQALVTIKAGGLLDVDTYTFGTLVNKKIDIMTGGLMKVRGNATAQINADLLANNIINSGPGYVRVFQRIEDGQLYTYVPEPATVALLGLGSLMLLRRKR